MNKEEELKEEIYKQKINNLVKDANLNQSELENKKQLNNALTKFLNRATTILTIFIVMFVIGVFMTIILMFVMMIQGTNV
ncbi:MAG: hypothetical protein ACRC1F_00745 [Metamycoplasmataceae bacterium]